jgi:hypothetical protein
MQQMKKINFLQITIHFFAAYCCIILFRTITWIYNISTLEIVYKNGVENVIKDFTHYGINALDAWSLTAIPKMATLIGLLIAIIISLIVSFKKKWSLINSLIVFIICFGVNYFQFPIFNYLKKFQPIYLDYILLQLIITFIIFFGLGTFLFFSKSTINLIDKKTGI